MPIVEEIVRELECCNICGTEHNTSKCLLHPFQHHINDTEVPTKARLTLPSNLTIENMADTTPSIAAKQFLNEGTRFGPLKARKLVTLNPSIIFPIKIFSTDDDSAVTEYYLDTSDENECNWMGLVQPATTIQEQNLICFQNNCGVFFMTTKSIEAGTHLKVWYSPYYAKRMKSELLVENSAPGGQHTVVPRIKNQPDVTLDENALWTCKFCRKIENSIPEYAEHLQEHYKKVLSRTCDICKDNFESRVALRKHEKLFHQKTYDDLEPMSEMENILDKLNDNRQQCDNKRNTTSDGLVGGPLLNDVSTDCLENSLLMQPSLLLDSFNINYSMYNNKSLNDTQNLLMDNESFGLNDVSVDALLNDTQEKELDDLTLELGESILPQYVCDICLKGFRKIQYLLRHLKKHTGEFTCPHCSRVFCRKENLTTHSCLVKKLYTCPQCEKKFHQNKYLARHMAKHVKKFTCPICQKSYAFATELKGHNCSSIPNEQKPKYTCQLCSKTFLMEKYLRIHSKRHKKSANIMKTKAESKSQNAQEDKIRLICDICAETFASIKSLKLHKRIHEDPKFVCEICAKKFHRQDVLLNHKNTHSNVQYSCEVCNKKLKSKKCLDVHMLQHSGKRPYSCKDCGKEFFQRTNMMRHYTTHLDESMKCRKCEKKFPSKFSLKIHESRHTNDSYKCQHCEKMFKSISQLKKHERSHDETTVCCPYCPTHIKYKHSMRKHIINVHPEKMRPYESSSKSRKETVPCKSVVEIKSQDVSSIANREVFLSMPELPAMELDQEIQLGNNAYILDDGTIVQPQEEGNVMLYILDQNTTAYTTAQPNKDSVDN